MLLAACSEDQPPEQPAEEWRWELPPGFPEPHVPEDNPMTAAKVELGRHLFYDERLSYNETMSCGTCHEQARAFTDGKVTPLGSTGHVLPRNGMSLTNVAFLSVYTWANPKLGTLEEQALVPMFADYPLELGMQQDTPAILRRFADDPDYQELFAAAFPDDDDPFTVERIVQALASFQRTLISGDSAYDRFVYRGDKTAMSESAQRGMALFFSETGECYHCHAGPNFSTSFRSAGTEAGPPDFQNNGLYNLDGAGAYPPGNGGLYEFTGDRRDQGKFRVPTLRNVAVTAPYMHDGSIATLDEVLDHYVRGGRARSERVSSSIQPLALTADERKDLIAFLQSLTDEEALADPRWSDPWERDPARPSQTSR